MEMAMSLGVPVAYGTVLYVTGDVFWRRSSVRYATGDVFGYGT